MGQDFIQNSDISIQGQGNTTWQGIHNSNIHINNYGLETAPIKTEKEDEILEVLQGLSYKQFPPSEFYLVNCNRTNELIKMQEHQEKCSGHQFYFILSSPEQHPKSLVQRFIFEITSTYEEEDSDKFIEYKRISNPAGARRIDVQTVEGTRKIKWLKNNWLDQIKKGSQSFEDFLSVELPLFNQHFVASAYEFYATDWQDARHFELLLAEWLCLFERKANTGPQCLFFFIINIDSIHRKNKLSANETALLSCIKKLAFLYTGHTLIIDRLPQIKVEDVYTWLDKMFEGTKNRSLFEIWCKKNDIKSGFERKDKLDMKEAQSFIQKLWNLVHENRKNL